MFDLSNTHTHTTQGNWTQHCEKLLLQHKTHHVSSAKEAKTAAKCESPAIVLSHDCLLPLHFTTWQC